MRAHIKDFGETYDFDNVKRIKMTMDPVDMIQGLSITYMADDGEHMEYSTSFPELLVIEEETNEISN